MLNHLSLAKSHNNWVFQTKCCEHTHATRKQPRTRIHTHALRSNQLQVAFTARKKGQAAREPGRKLMNTWRVDKDWCMRLNVVCHTNWTKFVVKQEQTDPQTTDKQLQKDLPIDATTKTVQNSQVEVLSTFALQKRKYTIRKKFIISSVKQGAIYPNFLWACDLKKHELRMAAHKEYCFLYPSKQNDGINVIKYAV